ncbi:sigma-54 dependent transcriptional regulator [Pseudoalteromonas sp. Isolate6]|uniref:sigma-54-dependent transcriptional regulator n=1 Tax=Pseudoalteromonas sp. Isolate6 TaxID=2908527 RepID=UPI001EFE56D7|nr:sigma-54 dependent transcriptional regulator [Pseudoalteromonas sp. Isolate6]MCG9758220.1 sigma-54 dependent transcriptional regulator [Pseudoalteromonas sp. Isolate6]
MQGSILIVDDKADIRLSLQFLLKNHGFTIFQSSSLDCAAKQLNANDIDIVLLDMNYEFDTTSGDEGLSFLSQYASQSSATFIAMTAWSSVELAVEAMQCGAKDFFAKPWDNHAVVTMVKKHLGLKQIAAKQQPASSQQTIAKIASNVEPAEALLWLSPTMQTLKSQLDRIAKTKANILLRGENGTGKSQIANYIHQQSNIKGNFVSTNMAAIPESLFESEMFGHVKGAFTDAKQDRQGRFSMAEQGTLFLDEVGTLTESQQAKLLRVLETGEYEAVGSSKTQHASCRIISATNADLESQQQAGQFRSDLYFRLNTMEFEIPPLRLRRTEIIPLADFFIQKHATAYELDVKPLSHAAQTRLQSYAFPGNIRELSHMMERAILLCDGTEIEQSALSFKSVATTEQSEPEMMTLDQAEQKLIKMALCQCHDNVEDAAVLLGISKSALYRRLDKFDIKMR